MSDTKLSNAILYLRPRTAETIAALDTESNKSLVLTLATPPDPVETPTDSLPTSSSTMNLQDGKTMSRDSTPGPYALHPRVLRLGFDSKQKEATRGFVFGTESDSDIELPQYGEEAIEGPRYFRIHYNFNSGALLVTAGQRIRIGETVLKRNRSLLLMNGAIIEFGRNRGQYICEFPDLTRCAKEHEDNYRAYVEKIGFPNALYMPTFKDSEQLGPAHRSIAVLGSGGFGEVHKAIDIKTGALCAIKQMRRSKEDRTIDDQMKEVEILKDLHHPNIIQYHHFFERRDEVCIIMELAVNDLAKHLNSRKRDGDKLSLPMRCVQCVGQQALSAIEYLHAQGVIHRDLKHENILVTEWSQTTDLPTIKLADFGLATVKSEPTSFCGTPGWYAPEILEAGENNEAPPYNKAVDIWAMGKILKELLESVPSSIQVRGKCFPVPIKPAVRLSTEMMQEDPKSRPTAAQCLQDPWIIAAENPSNPPITKRDRSSSTSASGAQPYKRVLGPGAGTTESNPSRENSHFFSSSAGEKGASHPSEYDDEMAGISW